MDAPRFHRLTRMLGTKLSRRHALAAAGLAALAGATRVEHPTAQEASPAASPDAVPLEGDVLPAFLFV